MREIEVPMPKLSMTMEEGELIAWVKQEGDQVRAGDVIARSTPTRSRWRSSRRPTAPWSA